MYTSSYVVRHGLLSMLGLSAYACAQSTATEPEFSPPGVPRDAQTSSPPPEAAERELPEPTTEEAASSDGPSASSNGAPACRAGKPVDGSGGSFVECENGFVHRPQANLCRLPPHQARDHGKGGDCMQDSECTEKADGYCLAAPGWPTARCEYACHSDTDCGAGKLCLCGAPLPTCVPATCRSDGDCAGSLLCASYETTLAVGCPPAPKFACQRADDECAGSGDCQDAMCVMGKDGKRSCRQPMAACGRPFLVSGRAHFAEVTADEDGDWSLESCPRMDILSPSERAQRAARFAYMASLEHASIAAFARFTMQLLELGAPAELVAGAVQAQKDEHEHTRICFGLASAYAGVPLGPGPLCCAQALEDVDLRAVFELVVREGCIGESVAALDAEEEARTARDAVLRGVFSRIAADETRHAALAWRFVRWALSQQPALAESLQRLLHEACRQQSGVVAEPLTQRALDDVVLPTSRALLASLAA